MDIDVVKVIIRTLKRNYGNSICDLIYVFVTHNYEIRLAGETAREILMNKIPKNMELVTSASLHQMQRLFVKKQVPFTVNKKDVSVTLRYGGEHHSYKIASICPIGVTSQPENDGTLKAYWMMNAYQRIFTVNSIFIDFNGRIYDYFNGCDDVKNYQIRINNIAPDTLIRGDCLRIFKYFQLFGSVGRYGQDGNTLKAIVKNMSGLVNLRGELIWNELKTILMHPRRYECIETFFNCGGALYLGLPEKFNIFEFEELSKQSSNFTKHPILAISYFCAFLDTREDVMRLHQRLRLSAYERDLAIFLVKFKTEARDIDDLMYFRKMCLLPSGANRQISREYVLELLKYLNKKLLFESLLLMESPCHVIDPFLLQWKRNQLKSAVVEEAAAVDSKYDLGCERNGNSTKIPLLIGTERRVTSSKSNKKQRLQ